MRDYKEFLKLEDEVQLGFIQRKIADVQGELQADGQEGEMAYEILNQIWDRLDAMRVQKQGEEKDRLIKQKEAELMHVYAENNLNPQLSYNSPDALNEIRLQKEIFKLKFGEK